MLSLIWVQAEQPFWFLLQENKRDSLKHGMKMSKSHAFVTRYAP